MVLAEEPKCEVDMEAEVVLNNLLDLLEIRESLKTKSFKYQLVIDEETKVSCVRHTEVMSDTLKLYQTN